MHYRTFGKTGLKVSAIAFGCGRTGGLLIDGSDADRRLAVRKALEGGINWFDTASAYGAGKSEEALGWLLEEVSEDPQLSPPYVSTKVTVDPAAGDLPGQVEACLAGSLKRLRRASVTLAQLHNRIDPGAGGKALSLEQVLGPDGIADGLDRAREKGMTQFIGITALGDAAACTDTIASGRFDSAQVFYNLANPSAARPMPEAWTGQNLTGIIAAARATGTAVLAIRVLAGGIIALDHRPERVSMMTKDTDPESEELKAARVFHALGVKFGTRPEVGIRFALGCPDLSTVLVGIGEPGHVDAALKAQAKGPLPEAALVELEQLYADNFGLE
jgi:L-galactose dehydrogenase/L-glyceraldehyde 3-phosphate reductase